MKTTQLASTQPSTTEAIIERKLSAAEATHYGFGGNATIWRKIGQYRNPVIAEKLLMQFRAEPGRKISDFRIRNLPQPDVYWVSSRIKIRKVA